MIMENALRPLYPVSKLKSGVFYVGQQLGEQNESVSVYQIDEIKKQSYDTGE